jgi:hypothetical protein
MKVIKFIPILLLGASLSMAFIRPDDNTDAREKVERAVTLWADATFEFYDGVRFENFKEVPTQEAFALETKIETLKEFQTELKAAFEKGELKKTKEELNKQLSKIDRQVDS